VHHVDIQEEDFKTKSILINIKTYKMMGIAMATTRQNWVV
jgi:hypothetical protein